MILSHNKFIPYLTLIFMMIPSILPPPLAHHEGQAVTICVELKPKWGSLPIASSGIHPIKKDMCRYCMLQVVRKKRSYYCPIDLFSSDVFR